MDLEGQTLAQWVLEQQKLEREERQREREERQAEREKGIRLAELNAKEKEKVNLLLPHDSVNRPTLPTYKEDEDIATYLVRFERVAQMLQLEEQSYAVRIGCLLTGKAAELYTSLPPSTTQDYQQLKEALLTGFSKSPDGYRMDFRSAKIKVGQNYNQFATHLTKMFEFWVETSKVSETYDDLKDFIIFDQFLASLTPDLRLFIKERRTTTLKEAVRLADDWASARNAYPKSSSTSSR